MPTQEIQLFYETNNYKTGDTEITILGECNIIPNYCFHRHTNLKKVTIEEGVEVIQTSAFSNCFELEDIKLPQSIKEIHDWAFNCCFQINKISIPIKNISILKPNCFGDPRKSFGLHFNTIHLGKIDSVLDLKKHDKILKDYQRTCYQDIEIIDGHTILMQHTFPSPYTRTTNYKVVKNKDILSPITTIHSCDNIHNEIPIMLSTLDGEIYNIFGWGECLNEVNDFTKKVKDTHPLFNNEEEKWSYVFDWEDKPNKVFCLNSYLQKVLSKEVDIRKPIFVIWDTVE